MILQFLTTSWSAQRDYSDWSVIYERLVAHFDGSLNALVSF